MRTTRVIAALAFACLVTGCGLASPPQGPGSEGEVEFLGIAVRESATASLAFTRRLKVPYPSISDSSGALLTTFADSLPAVAVPTTYILDTEGRVAVRVLDKVTYSTLTALIEDVRAESEGRQ